MSEAFPGNKAAESGSEKVSKVEVIKRDGKQLRGTITTALHDGSTKFEEENIQQLKFHGVYQQDDRDLRKGLRKEGKERHYMMMIRARIPGGILTADQYLRFDDIADRFGNSTMRITTRQTFQLHGILKGDLKSTIRSINDSLITTLGGCGDQVRNTIACAMPRHEPFAQVVRADLLSLVERFSAKTGAYHEIWLDGEKVELPENEPEEPLYGRTYLPRKFKIGFTYEGDNCADVYSNDLGIVVHLEDGIAKSQTTDGGAGSQTVAGYTLLIGGGMGRTASDASTHPRLASPFTFVTRDELGDTCEAIITVQRDYGNREERKFARMKYLLDENGLDWFRERVEERLGRKLAPPRHLVWTSFEDHLGWHRHPHKDDGTGNGDGTGVGQAHSHAEGHAGSGRRREDTATGFLGIFVAEGRIKDDEGYGLKSALREIIRTYQPTVHLTTQQNMILEGIREADRPIIEERLRQAGVPVGAEVSVLRRNAMACPAMPTCGLAIAESERVLPAVLSQFEPLLEKYGLTQEPLTMRMTGCPNGCARPYISDIGFVGRVLGKYDVFVGADSLGTRLNELFLDQVPLEELASTLGPVIALFASQRMVGERFGNFCHRVGLETLREAVTVAP